jgi:hypothetical protein
LSSTNLLTRKSTTSSWLSAGVVWVTDAFANSIIPSKGTQKNFSSATLKSNEPRTAQDFSDMHSRTEKEESESVEHTNGCDDCSKKSDQTERTTSETSKSSTQHCLDDSDRGSIAEQPKRDRVTNLEIFHRECRSEYLVFSLIDLLSRRLCLGGAG